ncbi:MAG: hypothetical protein JNK87_02535 [Bryobacterales bacterium]|nr:hypothetical protein [Bryobacterales bacterium]
MGQRSIAGLPRTAGRIGLAVVAGAALISLTGCPQPPVVVPPLPLFAYKIGSVATSCKDALKTLQDHEPPIGGLEGSFEINFGKPTNLVAGKVSTCSHVSSTTGSWLLYGAAWNTSGQAVSSATLDISTEVNAQTPIQFQLSALDASGAPAVTETVSLAQQTDANAGTIWVATTANNTPLQQDTHNPWIWTIKSFPAAPNSRIRLEAINVGTKTISLASALGTAQGTWAYRICHPHDSDLAKAGCGLTNPYINQTVNKPFPKDYLK